MSRDDTPHDGRPADDDIEILEVVGLDDDLPPRGDDGPADASADEVEVVFEEAGGPPARPPREAGPGDGDERERILRLQAEFENLKKRVEREKDEFYRHATSDLVGRLLPVLDNFERAILHAGEDLRGGDAFLDGVRLIHKQLLDVLVRHGLRPVEALDRPFDPQVHEAVATEETDGMPANTVLAEFQRGYFFHDRLLRPAMVKVSTAAEESAGEAPAPGSGDDGER